MISFLSILTTALAFILLFVSWKVNNFFLRSIAIAMFFIISIVSLGAFIELTGKPRQPQWDILVLTPPKLEVISYELSNKKIYLWLRGTDGIPIYYLEHDKSGEKKKQLIGEARKAKKHRGKLFYIFREEKGGSKEKIEQDNKRTFRAEFADGASFPGKTNIPDTDVPEYTVD